VLDEAAPVPAFEGLSDASGWRCYVLRVPSILSDATSQRLLPDMNALNWSWEIHVLLSLFIIGGAIILGFLNSLSYIAVMMYGWAKVVFSWFTNDEKLCNIFSISYNTIDAELITVCLRKQSKGKTFKCIIKFIDIQFADLWNQIFVLFGWKLTMAHVVVCGW